MGSTTDHKLFKAFVVVVFISHCIQLVWNTPLAAVITSTTMNSLSDDNISTSISTPNSKSNPSIGPLPSYSHSSDEEFNPEQVESICTMLKSFLNNGAQRVLKCVVSNSTNANSTEPFTLDLEITRETVTPDPLETNELDTSGSSRIDIVGETFDGYTNSGNEEESLTRRPPTPGYQYGVPISSRPVPVYGPARPSESDPTKVFQEKNTIVVPQNGYSCPSGQKRDYRGYCRTVVRISRPVFNPVQYTTTYVQPVRYYYKKFVAVPAVHFIL